MGNDVTIDPTSTVDEGAAIGAGTHIWHYCHVMTGVEIGAGCILGQNVFVGEGVRIGNGVKIQNNVSVYSGIELQDDVFVGPSVVFTNVLRPRSFVNQKDRFKRTVVKTGATLGANSTIICGVTIGEYAMVGAGSVVTKDIPAYALFAGNPARFHSWIDIQGNTINFKNGEYLEPGGQTVYTLKNNAVSRKSSQK